MTREEKKQFIDTLNILLEISFGKDQLFYEKLLYEYNNEEEKHLVRRYEYCLIRSKPEKALSLLEESTVTNEAFLDFQFIGESLSFESITKVEAKFASASNFVIGKLLLLIYAAMNDQPRIFDFPPNCGRADGDYIGALTNTLIRLNVLREAILSYLGAEHYDYKEQKIFFYDRQSAIYSNLGNSRKFDYFRQRAEALRDAVENSNTSSNQPVMH